MNDVAYFFSDPASHCSVVAACRLHQEEREPGSRPQQRAARPSLLPRSIREAPYEASPSGDLEENVDGFTPVDLAGSDLAGFCAGTAVAGTCVQTFFAPLAACFMPSGACHATRASSAGSDWCWADAMEARASSDLGRTARVTDVATKTATSHRVLHGYALHLRCEHALESFSNGAAKLQLDTRHPASTCAARRAAAPAPAHRSAQTSAAARRCTRSSLPIRARVHERQLPLLMRAR